MTPDRARGLALLASAGLMLVFFVLHPQLADPADNAAVFQSVVDAGFGWRLAQVARVGAWLLILAGLAGARSDAGLAGTVVLAVGVAFQLVHGGFEIGLQLVLGPWLAATGDDQQAWLRIATSLRNADAGAIAMAMLASGSGLALLGLDVAARSRVLGLGLAALASVVAAAGLGFALSLDFRVMAPAFLATLVLHVWLGAVGGWLAREDQAAPKRAKRAR